MPLLPAISSEYVHKGLWQDLTAPSYRKYLWTTPNGNALLFSGFLGILGSIVGDRLWRIMRHHLQPAHQLSDPNDKKIENIDGRCYQGNLGGTEVREHGS